MYKKRYSNYSNDKPIDFSEIVMAFLGGRLRIIRYINKAPASISSYVHINYISVTRIISRAHTKVFSELPNLSGNKDFRYASLLQDAGFM
jgi:hypothetical protein